MLPFEHVIVIYNPNSTGDSPELAKEFVEELRSAFPALDVDLIATERAGHGGELAFEATSKYGSSALIISVSGDGGYNEVINGVMRATTHIKGLPYCAVLPGGNANDHYSSIYDRPLLEALKEGNSARLDLLKIRWDNEVRYAHSYVGLGITPLVAIELNKHHLSAVKESWLALRTFWKFRPFRIEVEGRKQSFDSFIMGNVRTMAKHLTLDADSNPDDGKFEVIRWPHAHKLLLVARLASAAFKRGSIQAREAEIQFKTLTPIPIQLDGEVTSLAANTDVTVSCEQKLLKTFY